MRPPPPFFVEGRATELIRGWHAQGIRALMPRTVAACAMHMACEDMKNVMGEVRATAVSVPTATVDTYLTWPCHISARATTTHEHHYSPSLNVTLSPVATADHPAPFCHRVISRSARTHCARRQNST